MPQNLGGSRKSPALGLRNIITAQLGLAFASFFFGNAWGVAPRFLAQGSRGSRRGARSRWSGRPRADWGSVGPPRPVQQLSYPNNDVVFADNTRLAARLPGFPRMDEGRLG